MGATSSTVVGHLPPVLLVFVYSRVIVRVFHPGFKKGERTCAALLRQAPFMACEWPGSMYAKLRVALGLPSAGDILDNSVGQTTSENPSWKRGF